MDISHLHFAYPMWLWAAIVIPCAWILFFFFYRSRKPHHQLEKFIDRHLLPYLLINNPEEKKNYWKTLLLWSMAWCCLTLALAGPRWSFREMESFSQDQSLVIVLDLSESMNTTDIKPSRLMRAKQKIEDLLNLSKGVKMGLLAFAADPHMISPLTEDKETIRHLLAHLETDLVYVQGSRLTSALEMASNMLEGEPGNNKAILVVSDGGFEDASAIFTAKQLAEKGIVIHVMGIGTAEGAPVLSKTPVSKANNTPIFSKLERERLNEISKIGRGMYLEAHYSDHDESIVLEELAKRADAQINGGKMNKFWDEHFYLVLLPVLPIVLWWFRRGYLFAIIFIFCAPQLHAADFYDYFQNSEERGKQALEEGLYEEAANAFEDPYRKGVAYYRAKNFAEAEKMFRQSNREDVASHAGYNLGNSLVQQQKLKEAIDAYEEVLKKCPSHIKAKENLELVKKMVEQQKQKGSDSKNSDQQNEKKENDKENQTDKGDQDRDQEGKQNADQPKEQPNENGESEKENQNDSESQPEKQQQEKPVGSEQEAEKKMKAGKSEQDQDADVWLNRISNEPKTFLKNKFYIESKKKGTKEGIDPW